MRRLHNRENEVHVGSDPWLSKYVCLIGWPSYIQVTPQPQEWLAIPCNERDELTVDAELYFRRETMLNLSSIEKSLK